MRWCRYNVVQYIIIFHTTLQWMKQDINQRFNSQNTPPYVALTGELWDVYCEIINRVITLPHCILEASVRQWCDTGSNTGTVPHLHAVYKCSTYVMLSYCIVQHFWESFGRVHQWEKLGGSFCHQGQLVWNWAPGKEYLR